MSEIPNNEEQMKVEVVNPVAITPHNKALYEAGKTILVDSITTGREFCKYMITVCTGAIPIYLGLLKFVLPDKYTISIWQGIISVIPAILFVVASIIFTIGYYPQSGSFSLDIPDEIERERQLTINSRRKYTFIGFSLFLIGNITAIVCIMIIIYNH